MTRFLAIFSIVTALFYGNVHAQESDTENSAAGAVSVAFDSEGVLWRASIVGDFVFIDSSIDKGRTFTKKAQVSAKLQEAKFATNPKVAIGRQGNIYLAWTQGVENQPIGSVLFSRSTDGGKSFEQAKLVHQNQAEITYRFDAISVAPDGRITIIWADELGLEAAEKANKPYIGAAIYYAVSTDEGVSFQEKQKLADTSCQCSHVSTTTKPDGTVVAFWRHVFEGNQRDHMIAELPKVGDMPMLTRVTFGRWEIDDCSHHHVALARGGEGANWWGYHMAYFDGKDKKPGLYYSRMDGEAWVSFPAKKFGENVKEARQPALLSIGTQVWLAWLETDADNVAQVMLMASSDGGKTWSDSRELFSAKGKVNNPQLLRYKDSAYLSVNTVDGLIVTPIKP